MPGATLMYRTECTEKLGRRASRGYSGGGGAGGVHYCNNFTLLGKVALGANPGKKKMQRKEGARG